MALNEELEKLKTIIQDNSESQDTEAVLQNILKYVQQTGGNDAENNEEAMQKLLSDLKTLYRPQATYYEYLLFVALTALIVAIFGEQKIFFSR